MAWELPILDYTLDSVGDNSLKQYTAVVPTSSDGNDRRFTQVATRGGISAGILQDNSTATGVSQRIRSLGVTKVAAGDSSGMPSAITQGTLLSPSSLGQAVPSSSGTSHIMGMALDSLAQNATGIITMLMLPGWVLSS